MKLSTAALVLLLTATSSSSAFTPAGKFGVVQQTRRRRTSTAGAPWQLQSTIDREMNKKQLTNNSYTPSPAEIAKVLSKTTKEAPATTQRASPASYLEQYENQSGASIIYSKLQEFGVEVVNGYSGGAVLPLLDQFHEEHPRHGGKKPIRWITNSNESSAGHVAEGIAKSAPFAKGLPVGVVIATSGPGVTNLITPLQDAICDGVPLLVLCGQAATTAPENAFQQAPAVALTTPCTKWSYQIKSAAELPLVMDYAFYVARNGRPGPVFVDLPKDLQNQILTPEMIQDYVQTLSAKDGESFAHLVPRAGADGKSFQALSLGNSDQGLSFDVTKDIKEGCFKLHAVKESSSIFHKDHHTTNTIIQHESKVNGSETEFARKGDLDVGSPMLKELVNLLKKAKKPVIIAGQGCNDCPDELKTLAETLQIPVTTTLLALGCFDERHELALNMMGMHGHPTPNFMVQEADLVVNIGSRFDDRITGRVSDFIPEARKAAQEGRGGVIHVDVRLSEMAKQVEPTYFVHSTGKNFLQTLNRQLQDDDTVSHKTTKAWLDHKAALEKQYPVLVPRYPEEQVPVTDSDGNETMVSRTRMSAQHVISELNAQLLEADKINDTIFSTGVGIHQMVAAQLLTWTQPRQMLSSGSLGTMGVALGYAIGAKLANGHKIVIAVDGDGSFNMTFTELKSVAEQKIAVKIIILDNESQMMVEYWQRLFHESRYLAVRNSNNPDYTTLADAFGIKNIYCDCEEELPEKMKEFLFADPDEPVLFHVRIERTPCLPLVAPGQALESMILEDKDFEVDASAAPS